MKYYCSGCDRIIMEDNRTTGVKYKSYCSIAKKEVIVKPVKKVLVKGKAYWAKLEK
jgi:hypothetical protein